MKGLHKYDNADICCQLTKLFNIAAHEVSRFQSPNDIGDSDSSCDDVSTADAGEETLESPDYASVLRTVGLCVCIC